MVQKYKLKFYRFTKKERNTIIKTNIIEDFKKPKIKPRFFKNVNKPNPVTFRFRDGSN